MSQRTSTSAEPVTRYSCGPAWSSPLGRALLLTLAAICAPLSLATTYEIGPAVAGSDCVEEFEDVANALKPGDTLILRGGRYEQSCRRALTIQGTRERPIVIRAANGEQPVLTRPLHNQETENNLELVNARHLVISGLVFDGGSIGVRLLGEAEHVELSDSIIRNTGNSAFAANTADARALVLRNNTVHTTGLSPGQTEGEGFYLGCHDGSCRTLDSLIKQNTLYDLRGNDGGGNDGIELKPGSGGNRIEHNRITGRLNQNDYPCILAYGGGEQVNVIENNVISNCSVGIYVVRDAVVRGNLVSDSVSSGIAVRRHRAVGRPDNVNIVNNTVWNTQAAGACLHLSLFPAGQIAVRNNALFCAGRVAIRGSGLRRAKYESNWVSGFLRGMPLGQRGIRQSRPMIALAPDASHDDLIIDPLIDTGTGSALVSGSRDLRGTIRPAGRGPDIGAIEKPGTR